jgi:class 3 adenylate cyclase
MQRWIFTQTTSISRWNLDPRSTKNSDVTSRKSRFFFTDVVGSTTYFDRFGDTAGLILLHRHDSLVTSAVEEFRGIVVKKIGDSVMAEFPEPVLAVRAAIAIHKQLLLQNQSAAEEERLLIRTGIHCGTGFRRGNDRCGDVINLGAHHKAQRAWTNRDFQRPARSIGRYGNHMRTS